MEYSFAGSLITFPSRVHRQVIASGTEKAERRTLWIRQYIKQCISGCSPRNRPSADRSHRQILISWITQLFMPKQPDWGC